MTGNASRSLWPAACLAMLLGLSSGAGAEQAARIGVIHWEKFSYASMMKNSYEMAVEAVNRSGGVWGQPVQLVYADDLGNRRGGENAVYDLVKNKGAVLLLGGYSSSNTLYTAMAAERLKTPFVVCTAADDRITQRRLRHVYRINPPAAEYAMGLEAFLKNRVSPTSMAIVYENSPYGTGAAMRMMWFCREQDIELVAIVPYLRERASREYFKRVLSGLDGKSIDVIYMVSYLNDAAFLTATIREKKYPSLLCGGAGGFTHHRFIERVKAAGEGLITAALWAPETGFQGAKDYDERYRKRFGSPPDYHGAEAYSALLVAADALNKSGNGRPESILRALDAVDVATPFGPVRFEHYGPYERQNRIATLVLQVTGQQFRCIWPQHLSSDRFVPPPYWRP